MWRYFLSILDPVGNVLLFGCFAVFRALLILGDRPAPVFTALCVSVVLGTDVLYIFAVYRRATQPTSYWLLAGTATLAIFFNLLVVLMLQIAIAVSSIPSFRGVAAGAQVVVPTIKVPSIPSFR